MSIDKKRKYRVSLALSVPANFEVEVDAKNKEEALDEALEIFYGGDYDETDITDADWSNVELDIEDENINKHSDGVFIEEIKL